MNEQKKSGNRPKQGGVILIPGGMGALSLAVAGLEAQRKDTVVILAGRRSLNEGGAFLTDQLDQQGIIYFQADISKKDEAFRLIELIDSDYGKIRRVIHCAGVVRDSLIRNKSSRTMREVLDAKVKGLYYLDEAAKEQPLEQFAVFSSVAAVIGNVGQADYAFANGFVKGFVKYRNEMAAKGMRSGKAISISWPLWEGTGMQIPQQSLAVMKQETGLDTLTEAEGLEMYEKLLKKNEVNPIVVTGDSKKIMDFFQLQYGYRGRKSVSDDEGKNREDEIKETIRQIISDLTKVPVSRIKDDEEFESYGIDSIMLMDMEERLQRFTGESSRNVFLKCNTIDQVAAFLSERGIRMRKPEECKPQPKRTKTPTGTGLPEVPVIIRESEGETGVAVVGMACRYPGADTPEEFWENLKQGKNCITGSETFGYYGGYIKDKDKFDPLFFHIAPNQAAYLDPQERLMLMTVWHALEDAGYSKEGLAARKKQGKKTGIFMGAMYEHYSLLAETPEDKARLSGNSYWSIANRISYFLDLDGPSIAVDTACSSGLSVVHLALQSIRSGECDLAVVGGVNLNLDISKFKGLEQGHMLETGPVSMSFGAGKGYLPGEGAGAVVLCVEQDAVQNRDRIYCLINSTFMNHSGRSRAYKLPSRTALKELIQGTLKKGGMTPGDISYYESAANGSVVGDALEINGCIDAFCIADRQAEACIIGTVKSCIGHLEAASGISQLMKTALQLYYKKYLPSPRLTVMNPDISLEGTPFQFNYEYRDWTHFGPRGRNALITSIGAGGTNVCILVSENRATAGNEKSDRTAAACIPISAMTEESLRAMIQQFIYFLNKQHDCTIDDIAFTLSRREGMKERLVVIADNREELVFCLEECLKENGGEHRNIITKSTAVSEDWPDRMKTAAAWVMNQELLDPALFSGGTIISLPGYVFDKQRYWINSEQKQEKPLPLNVDQQKTDRQIISKLLGGLLDIPLDRIDTSQPFDLYGMDSVLGMKFLDVLNRHYHTKLTISELFEYDTVERLTGLILKSEENQTPVGHHDALYYLDNFLLSCIEERKMNAKQVAEIRKKMLQQLKIGTIQQNHERR